MPLNIKDVNVFAFLIVDENYNSVEWDYSKINPIYEFNVVTFDE